MGLVTKDEIAEDIANSIMNELQIERSDIDKYIVTGIPENFIHYVDSYMSDLLPKRAKSDIQKIATIVEANVNEYIDGILCVGAKPMRQAQTVQDAYNLAMQLKPFANSPDDLFIQVNDQIGALTEQYRPLMTAIYNWSLGQDTTDIANAMAQVGGTLPGGELAAGETGSPVPFMAGTNIETSGTGYSAPLFASKAVPIKLAKEDDELAEFIEPGREEDPVEYYEDLLSEHDPEELSFHDKEDLVEDIESGYVDPLEVGLDEDEAAQIIKDVEEAEGKPEEEPEAVEEIETPKDIQDKIALPEKFNKERSAFEKSFDHITSPTPVTMDIVEAVGSERYEELDDKIYEAVKPILKGIETNQAILRSPEYSVDAKKAARVNIDRLREQQIHASAVIKEDFIHDVMLTYAGNVGGHKGGLEDLHDYLKGWLTQYRPGWVPTYNLLNSWANESDLPPELKEVEDRIQAWQEEQPETYTGISHEIPPDLKGKISREIIVEVPDLIDQETGEVTKTRDITMPNPLWTKYETERYKPGEEMPEGLNLSPGAYKSIVRLLGEDDIAGARGVLKELGYKGNDIQRVINIIQSGGDVKKAPPKAWEPSFREAPSVTPYEMPVSPEPIRIKISPEQLNPVRSVPPAITEDMVKIFTHEDGSPLKREELVARLGDLEKSGKYSEKEIDQLMELRTYWLAAEPDFLMRDFYEGMNNIQETVNKYRDLLPTLTNVQETRVGPVTREAINTLLKSSEQVKNIWDMVDRSGLVNVNETEYRNQREYMRWLEAQMEDLLDKYIPLTKGALEFRETLTPPGGYHPISEIPETLYRELSEEEFKTTFKDQFGEAWQIPEDQLDHVADIAYKNKWRELESYMKGLGYDNATVKVVVDELKELKRGESVPSERALLTIPEGGNVGEIAAKSLGVTSYRDLVDTLSSVLIGKGPLSRPYTIFMNNYPQDPRAAWQAMERYIKATPDFRNDVAAAIGLEPTDDFMPGDLLSSIFKWVETKQNKPRKEKEEEIDYRPESKNKPGYEPLSIRPMTEEEKSTVEEPIKFRSEEQGPTTRWPRSKFEENIPRPSREELEGWPKKEGPKRLKRFKRSYVVPITLIEQTSLIPISIL